MIIARLSEIWKEYQGKLDSKKLNEILDRGICYSEIKHESSILVTGINPSFRLGDVACYKPVTTFNYQWLVKNGHDSYFHAINELFPKNWQPMVEYLDVLNFRETDQNTVLEFCKDTKGLEFIAQNLRLNQLIIEQVIRPRLIVVKNRSSWGLWGKNATSDQNIWMGYQFELEESLDCGDLCHIKGLIDHPDRVSYDCLLETNLKGTLVLFTYHSRVGKDPSKELIQELCTRL